MSFIYTRGNFGLNAYQSRRHNAIAFVVIERFGFALVFISKRKLSRTLTFGGGL